MTWRQEERMRRRRREAAASRARASTKRSEDADCNFASWQGENWGVGEFNAAAAAALCPSMRHKLLLKEACALQLGETAAAEITRRMVRARCPSSQLKSPSAVATPSARAAFSTQDEGCCCNRDVSVR
jgi:hypothetical protein